MALNLYRARDSGLNAGLPLLWVALVAASTLGACSSDDTDEVAAGPKVVQNDAGGALADALVDAWVPQDAGSDTSGDSASPPPDVVVVPQCDPPCPVGYACFDGGVGAQPRCLVAPALACAPCTLDQHCLGGKCQLVDGEGPFCLIPCIPGSGPSNCPAAMTCTPTGAAGLCLPDNGSCSCGPTQLGKARPCEAPAAKNCPGAQTCAASGWTVCDVPAVSAEICDGLDNDCDGKSDEDLPAATSCLVQNDHGTCPGQRNCAGVNGWTCKGKVPSSEACNAADDDCDGQTDEPWMLEGKYVSDLHCGLCNNDCTGIFSHGVGACDPFGFPPHCVVAKCETGYVVGPKGTCVVKPPDPCVGPTCPCAPANAGQARPCKKSAAVGTCEGVQICQPPSGWSACSASEPTAESCNGIDDDCDGAIDEGVGEGDACSSKSPAGTCAGKQVCAGGAGLFCDAPLAVAESCNGLDDDCDGLTDEPWLDAQSGWTISVDHCGSCNNACPQPAGDHIVPACAQVAGGLPTCSGACEPGFYDANGVKADGCECKKVSETDKPDGSDANCDGVDGDVAKAVFVAKVGSDAWPGTREQPVATLGKGIALAAAQGKTDVYVGAGAYQGEVTLAPGVSVYGGYGKAFTVRNPASHETLISGASPVVGDAVAVRCKDIVLPGLPTRLEGITVMAGTPLQPGRASVGLHIDGCDGRLVVQGNRILAGNGAPGSAGQPGGHGSGGKPGAGGKAAHDLGHKICGLSDVSAGGKGGLGSCGVGNGGGQGGAAICPDFDESSAPPTCPYGKVPKQTQTPAEHGTAGQYVGGGAGGVPGADAYIDPNNGFTTKCKDPESSCSRCEPGLAKQTGGNGAPGTKGADGKGGVGCLAKGALVAGQWQAGLGAAGEDAQAGGGGGGGGAAGGVEVVGCTQQAGYHDIGGSGGGGGSGGCAGSGGKPGAAGGASFAVLIIAKPGLSVPTLSGNVWIGGKGGDGGAGGQGGYGGFGGMGGAGGPHAQQQGWSFCAHQGGAGGKGGDGGHGGGGGGGCGGPSVLLAVQGMTTAAVQGYIANNTAVSLGTAGVGGKGGASAGKPGWAGANGVSAAYQVF